MKKPPGHGTTSKYQYGCRCSKCRTAVAAYERNRYRQTHRPDGQWEPFVSPDEAREHVLKLMECGLGQKMIARMAGVSFMSVHALIRGQMGFPPSQRIRRETSDRLLAVNMTRVGNDARIDSSKMWKQVDHLLALGYTRYRLKQETGVTTLVQPRNPRAKASSIKKVDQFYRRVTAA